MSTRENIHLIARAPLNKCLPFSDTSHCLCHFVIHDSRAPFRISIIDEISSVSSIFSASSVTRASSGC